MTPLILARSTQATPAASGWSAAAAREPGDAFPAPDLPSVDTVLIASSSWWAFPAQMAIRLAARGVRVEAICPTGHPLRHTASVSRCHAYAGLAPETCLRRAIARSRATLLLPCDDRAVAHLHALHARAADTRLGRVIERSVGPARGFGVLTRRSRLIALARQLGIDAPEMRKLRHDSELEAASRAVGLPAVLKVDGSWGGLGVVIAADAAEAHAAFRRLSRPVGPVVALKRLLVDRDPFSLLPALRRDRPTVNLQRFASGRPATCALACWRGELLACSAVEVLHARTSTGASTVVRRIEHPAMEAAARAIVRALALSGLCGLDFVLDDDTGRVALIECNARATPLCHLDFGPGRDPLDALVNEALGPGLAAAPPPVAADTVAFFPQAWRLDAASPALHAGHHDVPWADPALVRELMRTPYPERGLLARALARARPAWHRGQRDPWQFDEEH